LSTVRRSQIRDNEIFVSAMTVAEVAIKASLGKLRTPAGLDEVVRQTGFRELAFTAAQAEALRELPWHHRDPFDRILVVQAIAEGLHLATSDTRLRNYPLACV
jgi:PIN domain nuclease of toxin-antitoxin system